MFGTVLTVCVPAWYMVLVLPLGKTPLKHKIATRFQGASISHPDMVGSRTETLSPNDSGLNRQIHHLHH